MDAARNEMQAPLLGSVVAVDASRIVVELSGAESIERVTAFDLVAFATRGGHLLGLVDGVIGSAAGDGRDLGETRDASPRLRVMPLGTFLRTGSSLSLMRGAAFYPHLGDSCHLVEGRLLHELMAVSSGAVVPRERLELGCYTADQESRAVVDGNRLFQRHLAVLGSTGVGKSWAVATMLERASRLRYANLIVFDLHGEYRPLTKRLDGPRPVARYLRVAGPAESDRASDELLYLPYWLLKRNELLALVLDPSDPDATTQIFRLTERMQTLRQTSLIDAGRQESISTFTVDSPIPYGLENLLRGLKQDDAERNQRPPSGRLEPGPYFGRLSSLISRLEARIADPRFGFIFNPPQSTSAYEWLPELAATLLQAGEDRRGIKIVDLSEVPSAILPVVAGALVRLVYDFQLWMDPRRRTPICLVCDEAHVYLPSDGGSDLVHQTALQAFEAIAKEGRKYGVSLLVVSQRPTDISRTILSQCNNFLVMRMNNDHDRATVERLLPETLSGVTEVLPLLDVGEAMVIGDAAVLPTRIKIDAPAAKPASTTQAYWSLWAEQGSSRDAIVGSVEALRSQVRTGG